MHYDCVLHTDRQVGRILSRLEEDGILENTAVFLFSDHGMRLPRHKQFIYEGGHKVPLMISWPGGLQPGTVRTDLVSGIDISATSLALAGIEIPEGMEGQDLFASNFVARNYVVAAKDRCDFTIDRMRTVRTRRYCYVRNFLTDRPYMQPQYRDGSRFMELMRTMYANGELASEQAWFWAEERPEEEFYDCEADPHAVQNLVDDPLGFIQYQDGHLYRSQVQVPVLYFGLCGCDLSGWVFRCDGDLDFAVQIEGLADAFFDSILGDIFGSGFQAADQDPLDGIFGQVVVAQYGVGIV